MKRKCILMVGSVLVLLGIFSFKPSFAEDETFYCEVLAVEGVAYLLRGEDPKQALKEGDLLSADDEVETAAGSSADLAFDKDWSNVTRVEEGSRVRVKSVFPTRLYLDKGALYAKLKSLPKDSVFQVETPTAIAAVRGTEYRTEYADGETSISNDSEKDTSQVYIYKPHAEGKLIGEPTVLPRTQFTGVARGAEPRKPQPMNELQQQRCQQARGVLDQKIRENQSRGRVGKIQDLKRMERFGEKMREREGGQSEKIRQRRDHEKAGGPNDPPGGSGTGRERGGRGDGLAGEGRASRKMDWVAEGREDGDGRRFRNEDPGPRQGTTPPDNQLPGKDIRPAGIHGDRQSRENKMRAFEAGMSSYAGGESPRADFRDHSDSPQALQREAGGGQPQVRQDGRGSSGPANRPPQGAGRQIGGHAPSAGDRLEERGDQRSRRENFQNNGQRASGQQGGGQVRQQNNPNRPAQNARPGAGNRPRQR